jgi:D-alanyl-D-alanine carboxypeptidase
MTAVECSSRPRCHRPAGSLTVSIAVTALVLAGCGSETPSASTSSATSASASGSASSGDPAYVEALQPQLDQLVADMAVTGAVVLVRSPELGDWTTTIGTRTWHGTDPVTLADHVRIGSNTKTWTGTVILQLVDEGLIGLEDPVSKYRPDVPNGDNITIAQLLDMSSGLANYTTNLELNEQQDSNPSRVWTPEELLAMGLAEPPAFPRVRATCTPTPTSCC